MTLVKNRPRNIPHTSNTLVLTDEEVQELLDQLPDTMYLQRVRQLLKAMQK